ncbi:MAG: ABC transporter ATP-binding protein [Snowella sp.]|nr:ABC transporter ATP-binding protein [Snowella sp.]
MAKVVVENLYKSFPSRSSSPSVKTPDTEEQTSGKASESQRNKSSQVNVLRSINLTIEDGEFMVLVGPSGCGKSTLLRLIAGLEEVTGGNIFVGDRVVNQVPPKERDIAMVFQSYALYPHLSVYDNIAFGLRRMNTAVVREAKGQKLPSWLENTLTGLTRKLPRSLQYRSAQEKAIQQQVREVAARLQIEPFLDRLPKQLSGGQKQRVALGRAIARNPQVFLMDEPLSNLDAKLRAETRSQIVKLQRQLGITTIYVTHDQTEAMTMGDRIAVMYQGEIQQLAPPLELYNQPANRFVAEFIGSPPMNFIQVGVESASLLTHPQFKLTLPEYWHSYTSFYPGRSLLLGIRPEHFAVSHESPENLQVQVDLVEALGNETYLLVHLVDDPSISLQIRISPDYPVQLADTLWLAIALDKIHLFDAKTEKAINRD